MGLDFLGKVAERSNALALKAREGKASAGSNPVLSVCYTDFMLLLLGIGFLTACALIGVALAGSIGAGVALLIGVIVLFVVLSS